METRLNYARNLLIAIDQLINAIFGGPCDETISAMAHRRGWKGTEAFINWLFRDEQHCAMAYVSEMDGSQNAKEYRRG